MRRKIQGPDGKEVEGEVIGVHEATERYSDVQLDDGAVLKIKATVIEALRIDGQFDVDGNPVYVVKSQNTVAVVSPPSHIPTEG